MKQITYNLKKYDFLPHMGCWDNFNWKEIFFLKTEGKDGRNRKLNFTLGVRESTHYTAVYMIKAVEAENCQSEEKSSKQKLAYYLLLPILTVPIPPWIKWIQKIRETLLKALLQGIKIQKSIWNSRLQYLQNSDFLIRCTSQMTVVKSKNRSFLQKTAMNNVLFRHFLRVQLS